MSDNVPARIAQHRHSVAEIAKSIAEAVSLDDLTEARARVEAVRAWARVHGQVRHLRADLLTIEVEALVRIIELGGQNILTGQDLKAAKWLATMTRDERARLMEKATKATTAVGMCRTVWREAEIQRKRTQLRDAGIYLTENPDPPESVDDETFALDARRYSRRITATLNEVAERYTTSGNEFTESEMADHILADAGMEGSTDPDVLAGVRAVCKRVIGSTPSPCIDGTAIPRIITARNGRRFTRIPVMRATLAHLDDMIALRRAQIAADHAAVEELADVAEKLRALAGGQADANIGELIGASLKGDVA